MIDSKQLNEIIRRICYDKKIDKKDVAKALGMKPQTLSDYTGGKKIRNVQSVLDKILVVYPEYEDFSKSVQIQNSNGIVITGGNNNSPIDNRQYYSDSPDVLRAQIDLLEERIKEKDAQIKEKDAQIKEKDAQIKEKDAQINRLLDILSKR